MRVRPSVVVLPLALVVAACADDRVSAPSAAPAAAGTESPGAPARVTRTARSGRAGGGRVTEQVFPVSFRLRGGTCGLVTDVEATGELRRTVETAILTDGREVEVAFHDVATGVAHDADGTEYTFDYENRRQRFGFTGRPPLRARIVDQFNLRAVTLTPDVPQVHTWFDEYFAVAADGSRTLLRRVEYGNPAECDPL